MTNGYLIIINLHGNAMTPRQRNEVQERWDKEAKTIYAIHKEFQEFLDKVPTMLYVEYREAIDYVLSNFEDNNEDAIGHGEYLENEADKK